MQIGIFTKTFPRPTVEQRLDAVKAHGLNCVQFNLACAGLPTLPDRIGPAVCERIRKVFEQRGITMAAVSGTFNMIHPNQEKRGDDLRRLGTLTAACRAMGTSIIALCTGTRDPNDMWKRHPDNDQPQAWAELVVSMGTALKAAEQYDVILAFEPEIANVVDSALKARRLIDEMASPHLKVVIDPANLFHTGELPRMRDILHEAIDLLGKDIVIAHAKDLDHDGEAGHLPAGKGLLDYDYYLSLLHSLGYDGPLILHGLSEADVDGCVDFLKGKVPPKNR